MRQCFRAHAFFVVFLLLGACHSSSDSMDRVLFVGQQPLQDEAMSVTQMLRTGAHLQDVDSFWYCTYTINDEFVNRVPVHFLDSGEAVVNGVVSTWSYDQSELLITTELTKVVVESPEFDSRIFLGDRFSATNTSGLRMACDWTGPRRLGASLLNDGGQSIQDESGEEVEIDILLVTGNSLNSRDSYWRCGSPVQGWEFPVHMFSDGTVDLDGSAGRWSVVGTRAVEVALDSGNQLWSDIEIQADPRLRYVFFRAKFDNDAVECYWAGAARASEYSE